MRRGSLSRKEEPDGPIVKLVNLILLKAISERASDIHIEPLRNNLSVRIRVDGILREEMKLPSGFRAPLFQG